MKGLAGQFARAREAQAMNDVARTAYHMTVSGFVAPLWFHVVANGLAAIAMALLGHPIWAAAAFVAYCAVDLLNVSFARHCVATAPAAPTDRDFNRLVPMCALRMGVYIAPTTVLALGGGRGELLFFGVQFASLLCVAMSLSMMSRRVFAAFVTPLMAAAGVIACASLPPLSAAGVLLALFVTAALLCLIMEGLIRSVHVLHKAYKDNAALIPELTSQRTAADEAREAARQAGHAKANFLATMSHEIRTPMNGVLGMAQLIKRDETDPAQRERIDVLIESGEYLLSILNDILDVSKIDAGRLDLLPTVEDMHLFLDRLVAFWGPRADEKGVALVLDRKPSVPEFVLVDALRLRQVLFNLIGNALKFTETGSVTVTAEAMPNGEGAALMRIAVTDTGIGIPAEQLASLFTRFSQGDTSEVRKYGGTGLGLAIAKQLIDLMGGRIRVESRMGAGSTFLIELPLALAKARPAPARPAAEPVAEAAPKPLRVLAVDDNAVNLLVLEQLLASFGHDIAKAGSGAEALAAMAEQPFDVVLLDIQMPGMTGVEVLQQLRAGDGPNCTTPVVAVTADVTSGGRSRYLDLGFTDHSSKPIQMAELAAAIARAVSTAPRMDEVALGA